MDKNNKHSKFLKDFVILIFFVGIVFFLFVFATKVWTRINIAVYVLVFISLLGIIISLCIYLIGINADRRILIVTSLLLFIGVNAQAFTHKIDSPVRNVFSDIYYISHSADLLKEYKKNEEICQYINNKIELYSDKFDFDVDKAVNAYEDIRSETRINIDRKIKMRIARSVLDELKEIESEKSSGKKESEYAEKYNIKSNVIDISKMDLIEIPEKINGTEKQKLINKQNQLFMDSLVSYYHANSVDSLISAGWVLDYHTMTKIDTYLSERSDIQYQAMLDYDSTSQYTEHAEGIIVNLCLGFLFAVLGILLFSTINIYLDGMIMFFIEMQFAIQLLSIFKASGDGASIVLGGITVLEFVKPLYIIILCGLVGKKDENYNRKKYFIILPFPILRFIFWRFSSKERKEALSCEKLPWYACDRIYVAFWYTAITIIFFVLCSEIGTVIPLLSVYIFIMIISCKGKDLIFAFFCSNKEWKTIVKSFISVSMTLLSLMIIFDCCKFYYKLSTDHNTFVNNHSILAYSPNDMPEITNDTKNKKSLTEDEEKLNALETSLFGEVKENYDTVLSKFNKIERTLIKIGQRVYAFKYYKEDEFVARGSGSQNDEIYSAITVGDWVGNPNEANEVYIAISESDMVFAQLIQTTGILSAVSVVCLFILLLMFSYFSVCLVVNYYYRLIGMGIIYLLITQNILHILINIGLWPISGVPLMYISSAGTNQFISLVLTFMLFLISTNKLETDYKSDNNADNYLLGRQIGKEDENIGLSSVFSLPSFVLIITTYVVMFILMVMMLIFKGGTKVLYSLAAIALVTVLLVILRLVKNRKKALEDKVIKGGEVD